MDITCPHCGYEENTTTKVIQDVKQTDTLYEIGVLCDKCEKWTHCFFVTGRLQKMRQEMDKYTVLANKYTDDPRVKRKAKETAKQFRKDFAALQTLMKSNLEKTNVSE